MAAVDWDALGPAENRQETDELCHILSNSRRRHVIRVIDTQGALEKSELTDYVSEREFRKSIEDIETKERRRVHTALHQTHLEALEEAGVIVLEDGVIRKGERFDGFATVVERTLIQVGVIEPPSLIERIKRRIL